MRKIELTAFDLAQRFIGMKEVPGSGSNPAILAMLKLDDSWPAGDDVPWCSAFVNYICWLLRLPRSKSLAARSWLKVGVPVIDRERTIGFDIVILKRGGEGQPGPEVTEGAPGHVGFYAGRQISTDEIFVLGGNQGDTVSIERFPGSQVLGIRRIYE